MTKSTMGTKLPRKLDQKMQIVGEQIRLARLRRNLSIAQIAERATCSPLTVSRIEKGTPTVAIGIYLRVLYALQLDDDILLLAKEDVIGKALQDLRLKKRERASKKNKVWKDLSIYWFWLAKEIRTDWRAKLWIFSMLGYRRIAFYVCISNTMIISEVMVFFWLPREWILPSAYDMQIVK